MGNLMANYCGDLPLVLGKLYEPSKNYDFAIWKHISITVLDLTTTTSQLYRSFSPDASMTRLLTRLTRSSILDASVIPISTVQLSFRRHLSSSPRRPWLMRA